MRSVPQRLITVTLLLALAPAVIVAQKISKETIVSGTKKRTYYLYVPKTVTPATPVPLIVLLHGSNHIGLSLAEKWDDLAAKEGVIIVAPDSSESSNWSVPGDGPAFLHELVEALKTKYPINPKRVYLFGHSAGAVFALAMSLYEPEYFAATAIHAGALFAEATPPIDLTKRKMPIHIQVGTVDAYFPLNVVRATRDSLNSKGFSVQLVEIRGHDHWYYDLAPKINQTAWAFLKTFELPGESRYVEYNFRPEGRASQKAIEQYVLGLKRQQAGDFTGANEAYTRAIDLDKTYGEVYNNRGVAYMAQKDYPAAIADFTRSIELAPSDAAYNNRANIYFSQEKIEQAIADFSAGLKIKPSAEAYFNRGVAYQKTNRETLALADYEEAIKLNAQFARAYVVRGLLLLKSGKQDAAAWRDLNHGFQLDPGLHAEFDPMIKQLRPSE
jgi:tetratricopeptide (TPR) repeat protein